MLTVNAVVNMSHNELVAFMEDVNRRWPNPVCAGTHSSRAGYYCVGGAFMIALGHPGATFPTSYRLSKQLEMANPKLSAAEATFYAQTVVEFNEDGKFDEARAVLLEALLWKRGPETLTPQPTPEEGRCHSQMT